MTQSGQGHDPQNSAAGPAREGIVLPSGGGDAWAPDQQAAPPAGQPWGQPWGPGQPGAAPGPQPYGGTPAPGHPAAPHPSAPLPPPAAAPQQPMPPQQGYPPQGQQPMPPMPAAAPPMPPQAPQQQQHQQPHHQQPGPAPQPGAQLPPAANDSEATTVLPLGAQPRPGHAPGAPGTPAPQHAPYGAPPAAPSGELVRATPQTGAPLPPAAGDGDATTLLPPVGGGAPGAAPEPRDQATQMLRAVKPHQGAPQAAPMPGATDGSEATQLIPPVGGATGAGGPGVPAPPPGAPFGIRPGAPDDRPTPAEFDGLFRDGPATPGAAPAADATAQLPRFDEPAHPPYGRPAAPGGPFAPGGGRDDHAAYEESGGGRRRLPAAAVVGIAVVALAGVGLGVGWALSGGGGDEPAPKKDPGAAPAASAKDDTSAQPADDPAAAQAKGLDALLADSNNSRSAVIGAVQNIKTCTNLDGAAGDLRSAAGQRNDLIKRLRQLPVDKLPDSARLTAALTKAWQSSAAADNHYAAWADKTAGKGGCDKGHAKGGKEPAQGNAASGAATEAKKEAAGLWNPIAKKYGLRAHQPEQL
ncbi:hypothetical protein MUU72_07270 [Streptomyces sp. RS10V-4]|uniref:hypothetical protein n=1 Tax=Streptomyces rhizoryzae TaxID=2932493 RepID=UPI0020060A1E|nr:hypothetical protein [Streptomyces rhizoryzae]MCK7622898.1 hypothetical protein [Streptomyces rhizoryzae]